MASHPYISGPGNISSMVTHLRKNFPQTVDSGTIKKLRLASKNESYVINALTFIGVIDSEGKKTPLAAKVFSLHNDDEFAKAFGELVKKAYADIFELHGEAAWDLAKDDLIGYFRQSDQTSSAIGGRQAGVFKVFAALSGHGEIPAKPKSNSVGKDKDKVKTKKAVGGKKQTEKKTGVAGGRGDGNKDTRDVALTVRVEVNLPTDGTKETYDNIFKSIRENLIVEN